MNAIGQTAAACVAGMVVARLASCAVQKISVQISENAATAEQRWSPRTKTIIEVGVLSITLATVAAAGLTVSTGVEIIFVAGLFIIAAIDIQHLLIPDVVTMPMIWLGLLVSTVSTVSMSTAPTDAIYGAAAGYGSLWLIANAFELVTGQEGLGYGDLKLTAMIGAWLGWTAIPGTILIGAGAGFAVGTVLLLVPGHQHDKPMPFGPYLAGAGVLMLLAGPQINHAYLVAVGVY